MENMIEAIRIALHDDADPATRRAALAACREILTVLETATDSQRTTTAEAAPASSPPPAVPPPTTPSTPSVASSAPAALPTDPAAIAALVASIGKLPAEQLLDLMITQNECSRPRSSNFRNTPNDDPLYRPMRSMNVAALFVIADAVHHHAPAQSGTTSATAWSLRCRVEAMKSGRGQTPRRWWR